MIKYVICNDDIYKFNRCWGEYIVALNIIGSFYTQPFFCEFQSDIKEMTWYLQAAYITVLYQPKSTFTIQDVIFTPDMDESLSECQKKQNFEKFS